LKKLEGHTESIYSVAFSPDGRKIITSDYNGTVRIWETESGKELQQLRWHESKNTNFFSNTVFSAVFSPDGKKIATASADKTVRIWNLEYIATRQ